MEEKHVERVERAIAELGYSVVVHDKTLSEREAWAVENIVEGLNNHMAENADLKKVNTQLRAELDKCQKEVGFLRGVFQEIREALGL